jgi:hypothetical protein
MADKSNFRCRLVELMLLLLLLCSSTMGKIIHVDDDAGDTLSPVMYELHPRGYFINMGAYGGTEKASKSYIDESS